jgi:hypothetical protein
MPSRTPFRADALTGRTADVLAARTVSFGKRLRVHGLIKKVGKRYKYYLTEFGRQVVVMALKLRETVIIPELALAYPTQV